MQEAVTLITVTPAEVNGYEPPLQDLPGDKGDRQVIDKTNYFGQAGKIYRSYPEETKQALIRNLIKSKIKISSDELSLIFITLTKS